MATGFPSIVLTASGISAAAGTLLSLLASYIPGFNKKFASLSPAAKQLWMLLAIVVVTAGIAVLSFTKNWPIDFSKSEDGWIGLAILFVQTVIANQAVYKILPQTSSVTVAGAAAKAAALRNAEAVVKRMK